MKQKVQYPDFTEQLKAYKTRYNKALMACLNSDHLSEKLFFSGEFTMQVLYESHSSKAHVCRKMGEARANKQTSEKSAECSIMIRRP